MNQPQESPRQPKLVMQEMPPRQGLAPVHDLWAEFQSTFRNTADSLAASDSCFFLPNNLLKALDRAGVTSVTASEKPLSRFATKHGINGFWRRMPVINAQLDRINLTREDRRVIDERSKMTAAEPLMRTTSIMTAYMGWLITHKPYVWERDQLRQKHGSVVDDILNVHALQFNFIPRRGRLGRSPLPPAWEQFLKDYEYFCSKWCLEYLQGWHLPVLLQPNWDVNPKDIDPIMRESGTLVYIPHAWRFMGGVDPLIIAKSLANNPPAYLRDWLEITKRTDRKGNVKRYDQLFYFCFYWQVIQNRHAATLKKNGLLTKLKQALAAYIEDAVNDPAEKEDLADRLFGLMSKRLKAAASTKQRK